MKTYYDNLLRIVKVWPQRTSIPVHIGEFGVGRQSGHERDSDIVRGYYRHMSQTMSSHSWPPTLWDDGGWFAIMSNFTWVYGLADAALGIGEPTPAPGPAPAPSVHRCCWGGCQQCSGDAWCDASASNCGTCGGSWCEVPAATGLVKLHSQATRQQRRQRRSLRAKQEADASAMLQGKKERRKARGQRRGEGEL